MPCVSTKLARSGMHKLPEELQRIIWSWYILSLRVRLFKRILCVEAPMQGNFHLASSWTNVKPRTLEDGRRWLAVAGTYVESADADHMYEYNMEDAVVYMGQSNTHSYTFARYSVRQDDEIWGVRKDYIREVGNTECITVRINYTWNRPVE